MGGELPPPREMESPTPVAEGRRGGRGASARRGRRDTCRQAVNRGGRAHRRGTGERREGFGERREGFGERSGGGDRRRGGHSRALAEEETVLLEFVVGSAPPRNPRF
jgi:hypothetical protein